ncbi:MAG: FAD:protein FMN transferase [Gammaproteobacteria bacterium]|nr:FAD:protein FMN transferase [Gammaproteobacteria bacterium]
MPHRFHHVTPKSPGPCSARRLAPAILFCFLLAQVACTTESSQPIFELSGMAMGTSYSVKLVGPVPQTEQRAIARDVSMQLEHIDALMSTWRPDSELSLFNASTSTDWFAISDDTHAVMDAALSVGRLTDGAFDVTVGPLVDLWGFGPQSSPAEPPSQQQIDALRQRTGIELLALQSEPPALRKTRQEVSVDLSGIAKGYAVDRLATVLDARNIEHYLVEIGGELRARGLNARGERWTIAVERPAANQRSVHRLIRISNAAVATSGNYRNYFEHAGTRYAHTLDPRTGSPVTHTLASVTVVGASAMLADALATGLTVLGPVDGFNLAVREELAALFISRTDGGFTERSTPSLHRLLAGAP